MAATNLSGIPKMTLMCATYANLDRQSTPAEAAALGGRGNLGFWVVAGPFYCQRILIHYSLLFSLSLSLNNLGQLGYTWIH
jgi:hypothetical protein